MGCCAQFCPCRLELESILYRVSALLDEICVVYAVDCQSALNLLLHYGPSIGNTFQFQCTGLIEDVTTKMTSSCSGSFRGGGHLPPPWRQLLPNYKFSIHYKVPENAPEAVSDSLKSKISGGACPQTPLVYTCLCTCTQGFAVSGLYGHSSLLFRQIMNIAKW